MTHRTTYDAGTPGWAAQLSQDVEASRTFYGDLLGWTFEDVAVDGAPPFYLALVDGDPVASLTGPVDAGTWITAVCVDDLDAARAAAEASGGTAPGDSVDIATLGRFHRLHDPSGAEVHAVRSLPDRGPSRIGEVGAWTSSTLAAPDPAAVAGFYDTTFGWRLEDGAFRSPGGAMVGTVESAPEGSLWTPGFGVPDVDVAVESALAGGATVVSGAVDGPGGERHAVLTDPTGARFALDRVAG